MLALKPLKSPGSICPACGKSNDAFDTCDFFGIHILGSGSCAHCGVQYYHNWPLGHGAQFPIAFTKNGPAEYSPKAAQWLAKPLIKAVEKQLGFRAEIHRAIRSPVKKGLLINCLDSCYGHVLWKLFNAAYYHKNTPEKDLVVLIPKQCSWLVPPYVAEVWQVDAPLKDFDIRVEGLNEFINDLNLDSLEIAPLGTHLDHHKLCLEDFFRTKPFDLGDFVNRSLHITFIWRDDRFWLRWPWQRFLWLVAAKFRVTVIYQWLGFQQRKAMERVAALVKKTLPDASFSVVGLGTSGTFRGIRDLRKEALTPAEESDWCSVYAESHLVVGVHGSSMLIPTALAAGFIELLPRYKIPFMTEDILMRHPPRYQLFLGRHLDLYTKPSLVAKHVIDTYRSFSYLQSNTEVEI